MVLIMLSGQTFKISLEHSPTSWVMKRRNQITEKTGKEFEVQYLSCINTSIGFLENVINYCVKSGVIDKNMIISLPQNVIENMNDHSIILKSFTGFNGPKNILVIIDNLTCKMCNVHYDRNCCVVEDMLLFRLIGTN